MCGIFAIFHSSQSADRLRARSLQLARRLRHRGPDWSGIHVQVYTTTTTGTKKPQSVCNVLAHERLAIVDPANGAQPLFNQDKTRVLSVNGEIYNHLKLKATLSSYPFTTGSDCEIILALYDHHQLAFNSNRLSSNETKEERLLNQLDGVFAFVLIDQTTDRCWAARDPIGVCSMYVGWAADGSIWFASELKALHDDCVRFQEFPPGHYWCSQKNEFIRYFKPQWLTSDQLPIEPFVPGRLQEVLEKSVVKRMMCDVPYGALLSGGLDSSLIASIVCRHAAGRVEDEEQTVAWYPRVHSFSIGLKGSPDLAAARNVANYLNTVHHECVFTVQQGLDAIRDVIYHIETYDVTTIRASTPMYLLSRLVRACGIKVLLSGEGADEVFGGYLYFHHAPTAAEFHAECKRKLALLSRYDCLRANKTSAAWGVEVRVPFLDKQFLDVAMNLNPIEKMVRPGHVDSDGSQFVAFRRMEKFPLRRAFAKSDEQQQQQQQAYLPDEVLWRQKEQFSDGVGYGWIDALKDHAEQLISDQQMSCARFVYPHNTPTTKEGYLYRKWFEELFPQECAAKCIPGGASIACSTEAAVKWRTEWAGRADPSGRAVLDVHEQAI